MDPLDKKISLIFIVTIAIRIIFHLLTNFTYDDAYITFRYVENLVSGNGFVYNPGEHVLGTTTPLFTLILSIFRILGLSIQKSALFISLLCAGATAIIIYRFAGYLRFTRFTLIPVIIYILFPRLLTTDTGGMETALFTLLVTAGIYFYYRQQPYYAIASATLASVTRPEGFLLLAMLLAVTCYKDKRDWLRYISMPLVIILPWFMFSYFYFGSIIPNSITAKLALYSRFGTRPVLDNLLFIFGLTNPLGIVLLLMAVIGSYWLWKKQNFGLFAGVWLLGMILPLAFSKTHLFLWYTTPIVPVYLLFAGASLPYFTERLQISAVRLRHLSNLIALLLVVVLLAGNINNVSYFSAYQHTLESVHKNIGLYLRTQGNEDDIVAAEDIGYIGYFSRLKIIDRDGLISPEVVPYNRSGHYYQLIVDYKPDWVVGSPQGAHSQFITDSLFLTDYMVVQRYKADFGSEYRIFRKKDKMEN